MKYNTILIRIFMFISFIATSQVLDDTASDKLVTQYESLTTTQFKENIYIHTDKDIYEPGEDLWFKAYLLNANDLKSSKKTEIIYVELLQLKLNRTITIVEEKYEALGGFADGHLYFPETLKDGTYQLRIHTKNTLESNSETIRAVKNIEVRTSIIPQILVDTEFSKDTYERNDEVELNVHVFSRSRLPFAETKVVVDVFAGTKRIDRIRIKTDEKGEAKIVFLAEKSKKATTIQLHIKADDKIANHTIDIPFKNPAAIQFGLYPEGGNLVENLPNTVAFKAVDHHGKPVAVAGTVYENGEKLHSFKAAHYGMGKFLFTPKTDKSYTVQLSNPKLDSVFQLPKILPEGIKLQVHHHTKRNIHFSIFKSKKVSLEKVYIRAQSHGIVNWMAIATLTKERVTFKLPLENFPQGIVEVTLFNERFEPIAERLVYANLDQKLNVSLTKMSKNSYVQKDKVTLKFKVTDEHKKPAIGNFSLSVHDHLYAHKDNDYAIMPHYYLFSELKGHVYDASYYFDEKNKNRAKHLDLLLLTQGWRNYVWNADNLQKVPSKVSFSTSVKGKLYQKKEDGTLQKPDDTKVQVILPKTIEVIETDASGNFKLSPVILKIAQGIQLIFFLSETENMMLTLENPFEKIKKITKEKQSFFPKTDLIKAAKKQSSYDTKFSFSETNYLEEVNLTSYSKRNTNLGNRTNFQPSATDYVCFQFNILNCINHRSGYKPISGKMYSLNGGGSVIYEYPHDVEEKVNNYNPSFVMTKGLYPEKEFYSPVYDKAEEKLFPDNRKTLFWAPNLVSDKNGEITVSFYTSDVQTTFLGTLEGTNGNGLLGTNLFQFMVY